MAKKTQIQQFRETARKLECDEDERKFDAALSKVARAKPPDPAKVAQLRGEIAKAVASQPKRSKKPGK
jgi:hypothetical protein